MQAPRSVKFDSRTMGESKIPSRLPAPKRGMRRSMSCPDVREPPKHALGTTRTALQQLATRAAPTSLNRKRPAAGPTTHAAPAAKKIPLSVSNANKPPTQKPEATSAKNGPIKHKVAAWDTKGQLALANGKIARLTEENQNLQMLTEEAQMVKEELENCKQANANFASQLEACRSEIFQLNDTVSNQEEKIKENESLLIKEKQLVQSLEEKSAKDEVLIKHLKQDLLNYQAENLKLQDEKTKLSSDLNIASAEKIKCISEIEHLKTEIQCLQDRIFEMQQLRRAMHNEILDLKGNIRIFCRVRPPLISESSRALSSFNFPDEKTLEIKSIQDITSNMKQRPEKMKFSYDRVFSPESTQADIFIELEQLVQSALDGYNVCIFAYGQTGSGKTFTMDGGNDPTTQGMIPRAVKTIFNSIEQQKQIGWNFTVRCSFMEIYNENIRDLLNPKCNQQYEIKMTDSTNEDVYVPNLKVEPVQTEEELRNLLFKAQKTRFTASTVMNEESSRSHSITQIKVEGVNKLRGIQIQGTLNLIDLAGSEKYRSENKTERKQETCSINKSLSGLSLVVMRLAEKGEHVPFRDSKLTHLLMPSLKGNSKTLMLVNIAPFQDCYQESLNSLRFASRVSTVRVTSKRQIKPSTSSVSKP